MVVVVVVFGRISTLVSLATLAEANQTDEKKIRKKREVDVCPQNARNQVRYTVFMMQCIYTLPFSIVVHASKLKNVVISNTY